MLTNQTILLTGFEAFGDWKVNPTAVASTKLNGTNYKDYEIIGEVIPLRLEEIRPNLRDLVDVHDPAAIVMSGQAGGDKIRLERYAHNEMKSKLPYNCGSMTNGELIEEDGIEVLDSSLPLQLYYDVLEEHEIPVKMSDSAGRFGCNQIFYHGRFDHPKIPSGFIHVPLLEEQVSEGKPWMSQEQISRALELICHSTIDYLIRR